MLTVQALLVVSAAICAIASLAGKVPAGVAALLLSLALLLELWPR